MKIQYISLRLWWWKTSYHWQNPQINTAAHWSMNKWSPYVSKNTKNFNSPHISSNALPLSGAREGITIFQGSEPAPACCIPSRSQTLMLSKPAGILPFISPVKSWIWSHFSGNRFLKEIFKPDSFLPWGSGWQSQSSIYLINTLKTISLLFVASWNTSTLLH